MLPMPNAETCRRTWTEIKTRARERKRGRYLRLLDVEEEGVNAGRDIIKRKMDKHSYLLEKEGEGANWEKNTK